MAITGRCLCGAVSYELTGEPLATVICHCRHCQRESGGAFAVLLLAPASHVSTSGELQTYTETGENDDGEYVYRRFCGACGSSVMSEAVQPGLVGIKVGTLDDKSAIQPTVEVWCEDRQPWVELAGIAVSLERET